MISTTIARTFKAFCVFISGLLVATSACAAGVAISWSPVGNPGNAIDSTGHGSVPYAFSIGTYEVTNNQYGAFLNAVAATDTYGLYNPAMDSFQIGGIMRSVGPSGYSYQVRNGYEHKPIDFVSWGDAARFCNWLTHGQPNGAQEASTTEDGSYALNGAVTDVSLAAVSRKLNARVVIPTENEWYKAAYYNPSTSMYYVFPTSSNTVPASSFTDTGNSATYINSDTPLNPPAFTDVGHFSLSKSPYGTLDQAGNAYEWNETMSLGTRRVIRGGSYRSSPSFDLRSTNSRDDFPSSENMVLGFRIAMVPEPSCLFLFAGSTIAIFARYRWSGRRRSS